MESNKAKNTALGSTAARQAKSTAECVEEVWRCPVGAECSGSDGVAWNWHPTAAVTAIQISNTATISRALCGAIASTAHLLVRI